MPAHACPIPACTPPPHCRDTLLKLEVIAPGKLNAIVFWFDLHLDDTETLTTGACWKKCGGRVCCRAWEMFYGACPAQWAGRLGLVWFGGRQC